MKKYNTTKLQKHLPSIIKYRKVLCEIYKYPVSLEQAITDWYENEFDQFNENRDV